VPVDEPMHARAAALPASFMSRMRRT
jgi:hypothetical protein